jgi:hypothetical protein
MVTPFKVNRALSDNEKKYRLNAKQPSTSKPHYELSLIKLNSTFVECVDKWYAMRGWCAMGGGVIFALFSGFLLRILWKADAEAHAVLWPIYILFLLLIAVSFYLLTRDIFTYTHYPIRFNRKNQQVYVFRRNGTVLKIGWDQIYWTIFGHYVGMHDLYVVGHVMEKDIVKETFALSSTDMGQPGEDNLRALFEFFRRYMQDGPGPLLQALRPTPLVMLPGIDKARESWFFGWKRLTWSMNGSLIMQTLFQPFFLPMSLFRWLAMRTSKIPQWPQWVLDECAIEPGDPWVRDERHKG